MVELRNAKTPLKRRHNVTIKKCLESAVTPPQKTKRVQSVKKKQRNRSEYQRQRCAEQKRLYRAKLDPRKLELLRRKDAERKRQYRASLSTEQLLAYRHRNAERKRQLRASLSQDQLLELRCRNAEQKRIQRLKIKLRMSAEELNAANQNNAEKKPLRSTTNGKPQEKEKKTKANGTKTSKKVQFTK